jgi:Ca-activated chloride channel family protein
MNKQDNLFKRIQEAAERQEQQSFQGKDKLWKKVEHKLNHKKRKRMILYRTLSAAAVIAVIIFAGFQFTGNQDLINENPIINKDINLNNEPDTEIVDNIETELKDNEDLDVQYIDSVDHSSERVKQPKEKPVVVSEIENDSEEKTKKQTSAYASDQASAERKLDVDSSGNKRKEQFAVLETVTISEENKKVVNTGTIQEIVNSYNQEQNDNLTIEGNQSPGKVKSKLQVDVENIAKGTVVDSDGLPIPGVNVIVKGTSNGTQTDFDGEFSIQVEIGKTLFFSYVGFKNQEVKIKNRKDLFVTLEPSQETLSEVVAIGYSDRKQRRKERRKQKHNNALPAVQNDASDSSISNQLQGSVAGVQVAETNNAANIRIRGASTINTKEPLFILNGKPIKTDKFQTLEKSNIESIKVLKDKNAKAVYGRKGANGVIFILTKDADKKARNSFDKIVSTPKISTPENNEDYETFKENPFTSPLSEPLSTFSIDVDRAAYTNIRRFINNAQEVPKDAVRIEEMLNFFEYNYDKPNGKQPFAIHTAYSDAPWNKNHKLLRIALQGKDIPAENLPASNLVFLIDVSGSMSNQNKLPLVKKSLNLLVDQMRAKDKIALVTYAGNSQVILEPTSGQEKFKIKDAINRLSTGGGTYASQGIETAYSLAEENFVKDGNNRVIIATDGDFNIGVTQNESLEDLISKKRQTNIFLTCLGYGMGNYKDSKMQSLSQKGNGNYAYIDTYQEAQKFLEREFKGSLYAIAKDVKIQIEFNPKHVDSYRLIGYETRMLEDRDFADDTKDAGEIGVNHQVTALYEVIPRGVESQFGEFNPNLKYQKVEQPDFNLYTDELATVKFRYKHPGADKSIKLERIIKNQSMALNKTSADFKFATAVAWFGLKLRDSQLISNADKEAIIELAKQGLENDKEGYRAEFIRLVKLYE